MAKRKRKSTMAMPMPYHEPTPAERLAQAADSFASVATEVHPSTQKMKAGFRASAMKAAHMKKGSKKG